MVLCLTRGRALCARQVYGDSDAKYVGGNDSDETMSTIKVSVSEAREIAAENNRHAARRREDYKIYNGASMHPTVRSLYRHTHSNCASGNAQEQSDASVLFRTDDMGEHTQNGTEDVEYLKNWAAPELTLDDEQCTDEDDDIAHLKEQQEIVDWISRMWYEFEGKFIDCMESIDTTYALERWKMILHQKNHIE